MPHNRTEHEPAAPTALAPEPTAGSDEAATNALADAIAHAFASGGIRPAIHRTLPDGSIEVQSYSITPDEVRAAVRRAAESAASLGGIDIKPHSKGA